jgi:hypothetical protein
MSETAHPRTIPNAECPGCGVGHVVETPEAGYATCLNCAEAGLATRLRWSIFGMDLSEDDE